MLYLRQEAGWKNDDRFAREALRSSAPVARQLPRGRASLLACLTNLEGLVHLQVSADPYMETANAFVTLSLAGSTPKVAPSL